VLKGQRDLPNRRGENSTLPQFATKRPQNYIKTTSKCHKNYIKKLHPNYIKNGNNDSSDTTFFTLFSNCFTSKTPNTTHKSSKHDSSDTSLHKFTNILLPPKHHNHSQNAKNNPKDDSSDSSDTTLHKSKLYALLWRDPSLGSLWA